MRNWESIPRVVAALIARGFNKTYDNAIGDVFTDDGKFCIGEEDSLQTDTVSDGNDEDSMLRAIESRLG